MRESFSSKFFTGKLRQKIAVKFGACPIQYKYLLHAERMVANRAQSGNSFLTYGVNCLFCIAISAFYAFIPFFATIDLFSYTLLGMTTSMLMVGLWSLPHFDLLLNPIHYPVVAHTPVSSRTYFLVKLTQALTYPVLLIASLNLLPAICGIWIREGESSGYQFFFPIVYLPISFMSGFFIIGVMTAFSGIFSKVLHQKETPKHCTVCAICVSSRLSYALASSSPLVKRCHSGKTDISAEVVLCVTKWMVCRCSLACTGKTSVALSDFSKYGSCFNPDFGDVSTAEYRKWLFSIPIESVRIWASTKI